MSSSIGRAIVPSTRFLPDPGIKLVTRVRKCDFFEDPSWKKIGRIAAVLSCFGVADQGFKKLKEDEIELQLKAIQVSQERQYRELSQTMIVNFDALKQENARILSVLAKKAQGDDARIQLLTSEFKNRSDAIEESQIRNHQAVMEVMGHIKESQKNEVKAGGWWFWW